MTEQTRPSPKPGPSHAVLAAIGAFLAPARERLRNWARAGPAPPGAAGAHWALETLALVALIALVEWKCPYANPETLGFSLFWIPVALMSGQYGSRAGLFATLAATAAGFGFDWPVRLASQDYYLYAASLAAQPSAWLAYALALGGLRDWHMARDMAAREDMAQTSESAEIIAEGLERSLSEIERLELRIAMDRTTLDAFIRMLAQMRVDGEHESLASFAELVRTATAADMVSLFLRDAHSFALATHSGDIDHGPTETSLASMFPRIEATREAVRWECPKDSDALLSGCAVPICADPQSVMHGVLVMGRAARGDDFLQAMRRVERLGRFLGHLLDALAPRRAAKVASFRNRRPT